MSTAPLRLSAQGCFFVDAPGAGHMYVEHMVPDVVRGRPVVMIHGGAQTGVCFISTPDGQPGWRELFVRRGHPVYVVDLPGHGRSANQPLGEAVLHSRATIAARYASSPQWPAGEDVLDGFFASQFGSLLVKGGTTGRDMRCCEALVDRVGDCIVLAHSLGATVAWPLAQRRADRVKAILAVEPNGPPFVDLPPIGDGRRVARPWGISYLPLAFEPAVDRPDELQEPTPRRLVGLDRIPTCVVTGSASYHAAYDDRTVAFLRRFGVPATHLALQALGIEGNGHMMMLERNHAAIARVMGDWLAASLP